MTIRTFTKKLHEINRYFTKWSHGSATTQSKVYDDAWSTFTELKTEYGEVLGQLKITYHDHVDVIDQNYQRVSALLAKYSPDSRTNVKLNLMADIVVLMAELLSIAKTLEKSENKKNEKIADLDLRLNSLYDNFNKIKDVVDEISKNLHK